MIQYEFGMFLALGGMAIHAGVIIIAGRSAALALKYAKRIPVQAHWKEEREREKRKKNANYSGNENSDSPNKPLSATPRPSSATEDCEGQYHLDIPPSDPSSSTMIDEKSFDPEANNLSIPTHHTEDTRTPTTPHSPVPSLTDSNQALHLSDFHRFLKSCESLQLMGTATFFLGVMILIFIMFFHLVFPIVLLVGCVASSLLMSWMIGFWKVSATNQLIKVAKNCWRAWMEIDVGEVPDQPTSVCSSKLKKKGKEKMVEVKKAGKWRLAKKTTRVHWNDEDVDPEKGREDERSD